MYEYLFTQTGWHGSCSADIVTPRLRHLCYCTTWNWSFLKVNITLQIRALNGKIIKTIPPQGLCHAVFFFSSIVLHICVVFAPKPPCLRSDRFASFTVRFLVLVINLIANCAVSLVTTLNFLNCFYYKVSWALDVKRYQALATRISELVAAVSFWSASVPSATISLTQS